MKLGALLGPIEGNDPEALPAQARLLETEGYDGIWTAQAIGRGFMMPDPFVALSAAAVVTQTVELGTAILQLPLYHPSDVALKSFSLSQLCGSRFTLGVGAGSTESDFNVHELEFGDRFRQFNDKLATVRQLFTDGRINESQISPWQFNGWIGSAMHRTPEQLEAALASYRSSGGTRAIVTTIQLSGDTDTGELKERLARFSAMGFDDAVVMFLPGAPSPADVRKLVA
jgi:hypothetical protein